MDSKEVVARFEAERQALAVMDHPGIAKVFDAGTTERGRPYFVMEFVAGIPLTAYCDRRTLSTRDRLELFVSICHAVQHAHQKGVIHRDLKPSNILVMEEEEGPLPKIIDFGIAKATQEDLIGKGMYTATGQIVGTPEYMSPEQADLSGIDVDTRTDIYSLGVVLYELLTGALPFESEELRSAGLAGLQKIIQEQEPPTPSAKLTSLGKRTGKIAKRRMTEAATLGRQLRGDLDWIIMRAMEKDRARRYETAYGFSMDIRRYLAHEPVEARPPSTAYKVGKFVRRNRIGVIAASAVTVALVAGMVGTGIGLLRARSEAAKANTINKYLNRILKSVQPGEAQGEEVTVRAVLDKAAVDLEQEFAAQPETEGLVRLTIGSTYWHLGHYDQAEPHLVRSVELLERELGPEHDETLTVMNELANNYFQQGRLELAESIWLNLIETKRRKNWEDDPDTLTLMQNLGAQYLTKEEYDRAEPLLVEAAEGLRRAVGLDDERTTRALSNLGELYKQTGRFDEAEPIVTEVLEIRRRVLGDNHPQTLVAVFNMSDFYREQEKHAEAEPYCAEALDGFRRVLPEGHPNTLVVMTAMADILTHVGKVDEAEPLAVESYEQSRVALGDDHWNTYDAVKVLVEIHEGRGDTERAAEWRSKLPPDES
jgi:non-specific serine/threonine protein kinase/serine/threonine-protein kinase